MEGVGHRAFHSQAELPRLVQARDQWVHALRDAVNRGGVVSTLAGSVGEGPPPAWVPTFWAPPPVEGVIWNPQRTGDCGQRAAAEDLALGLAGSEDAIMSATALAPTGGEAGP